MQRKAYIFSLDAIVAIGVMVIGIVLVLMSLSYTPTESQAVTLSQDLLNAFYSTRIYDLNDQDYLYVRFLKGNGNITNMENTILEQLGEFYYRSTSLGCVYCMALAGNIVKNISYYSIPEQYSFKMLVNNISLYERKSTNLMVSSEQNESRLLMTSKRIFSGYINRTDMWGPYTAEVIVWQ